MKILALDLGLNCGWAATLARSFAHDGVIDDYVPQDKSYRIDGLFFDVWHGTWHLKKQGDDFITPIAKFRSYLEAFNEVDGVAYEDVKSIFRGNYAALNYGGLKTIIELYALEREIPIYPIPVGTIKKWATGKGNSNKKVMMQTCEIRLGIKPRDDNEADALWLLDYIIKTHGGKTDAKG